MKRKTYYSSFAPHESHFSYQHALTKTTLEYIHAKPTTKKGITLVLSLLIPTKVSGFMVYICD